MQEKTCHVNKVQTALYRYIQYYSGYAEHEKTRRFQVTKDTEKAEEYKRFADAAGPRKRSSGPLPLLFLMCQSPRWW